MIVLAITIASCTYIFWRFRTAWFFGDEWSYIVDRRAAWSEGRYGDALFLPHNEHWTTLPIIAFSALFKVFALKTYLPYLGLLVALHGVTVMALHSLLRRIGVGRVASIAGASLFALFGAGAENLSWAFQIGFVGSIALGLLHLIVVDRPETLRSLLTGSLLGLVNVMTSGLAIPMLIAVVAALAFQRRYRAMAIHVGPAAVAYITWYVTYGHKRTPSTIKPEFWASYVERGVFATLEETTHLRQGGAVLAVLLLIAAVRWWPNRAESSVALGLLVGMVSMFAVFAIGRSSFGADQAASSRYLYGSGALAIGPLILMTCTLIRDQRLRKWMLSGAFALAIAGNASAINLFAIGRLDAVHASKARILATARRPDLGQLTTDIVPDPDFTPGLRGSHLRDLVSSGLLPVGQK